MNDTKDFDEQRAPRSAKGVLSLGAALLFAAGPLVGVVFGQVFFGVLLFALGAVLFAVRGYLNTGDKAVTGALIFVAVAAVAIQAIVSLLGP